MIAFDEMKKLRKEFNKSDLDINEFAKTKDLHPVTFWKNLQRHALLPRTNRSQHVRFSSEVLRVEFILLPPNLVIRRQDDCFYIALNKLKGFSEELLEIAEVYGKDN